MKQDYKIYKKIINRHITELAEFSILYNYKYFFGIDKIFKLNSRRNIYWHTEVSGSLYIIISGKWKSTTDI